MTRKGISWPGLRHPALPRYSGGEQAAHAGVRQTHGLLPAQHTDVE
jgi:hypothetical protein